MEQEKKKNIVIALLVVVIVILLALMILFATGKISLKANNNSNDNNGEVIQLTEEESINIVKDLFTNSTVYYLVNLPNGPYCNIEYNMISEKELGLDYTWNGLYKCTDFHSYEELISFFKKYVTDNFLNSDTVKNTFVEQKITSPDGTFMYRYYEKDGNLYAAVSGKGGDMGKYKFLENETVYKINSFNDNRITATITAKWEDPDGKKTTESENVTIVKENGTWKLDSYKSTEI